LNYLGSLKLFNHPDRYLEWYKTGWTKAPVTVKIDLTNKCNHNCENCIDSELRGSEEINTNGLFKILRELKHFGVKGLHYTGGGEPLLHTNAITIFNYTKQLGFETGLITNGSLLNEEIAANFDWIRVSLDAYNKRDYKKTHGKSANWEQTIKGIKSIIGKTFVTLHTLDCVFAESFIQFGKSLGVNAVQVSPCVGVFHDVSLDRINRWKMMASDDFGVIINEEKFNLKKRDYTTCEGQHFKAINICADGNVYICCQLAGKEFAKIGNIYQNTFKEKWESDLRKKTIKELDVLKCPELCVCDSLNRTLNKIKEYNHKDSI